MKIYTKRGDSGQTDIIGGKRVSKDHVLIEAYGTIDELNSVLGMAKSTLGEEEGDIVNVVNSIQNDLHIQCAYLAGFESREVGPTIHDDKIQWLENLCDDYQEELPQLKNFILPGGTFQASSFHVARAVCRRAERRLVSVMQDYEIAQINLTYLNRLSDLLYMMARLLNFRANVSEEPVRY